MNKKVAFYSASVDEKKAAPIIKAVCARLQEQGVEVFDSQHPCGAGGRWRDAFEDARNADLSIFFLSADLLADEFLYQEFVHLLGANGNEKVIPVVLRVCPTSYLKAQLWNGGKIISGDEGIAQLHDYVVEKLGLTEQVMNDFLAELSRAAVQTNQERRDQQSVVEEVVNQQEVSRLVASAKAELMQQARSKTRRTNIAFAEVTTVNTHSFVGDARIDPNNKTFIDGLLQQRGAEAVIGGLGLAVYKACVAEGIPVRVYADTRGDQRTYTVVVIAFRVELPS